LWITLLNELILKNMNKNIFIGMGMAIFLLLAIGGYFFWQLYSTQTQETVLIPAENNNQTQPSDMIVKKPNPITQTPKEGDILVATKDNTDIPVKDFYKNKRTIVYPKWGASLRDDPYYSLLYFTTDKSFLISLTGGDLHTVRFDAEKEFLSILGVTEEEACQLKVVTGVSRDASEKASGHDYGLSFCPSGKPLPKNL